MKGRRAWTLAAAIAALITIGTIGCSGDAAPDPEPLAANLIEAVTASYADYVGVGPRPTGAIIPDAWDDLPNTVGGETLKEALIAHTASQTADHPWMVDFSRTAFFAEVFAEIPDGVARNELLVEVRDLESSDCCPIFAVTMQRSGGGWRVGSVRQVGYTAFGSTVFYHKEEELPSPLP